MNNGHHTRIDARAERGRHRALRFRNRRQGPTVHFGVLAINPTSTHCSVAFRIIEANGRMHVRTLAIPVRPILDNCRPDEVPLE